MNKRFALITLLTSLTVLSACGSTPQRPAYAGGDTIGAIDSTMLIGVWEVRELNPMPNAEPQKTVIQYHSDGTISGSIDPQGEATAALGPMGFEVTGNWGTEGDWLMHSNIKMKSTNDNQFSALMSKVINSSSKKLGGQANVYEASAARLVMVGEDGVAMEYIRRQ